MARLMQLIDEGDHDPQRVSVEVEAVGEVAEQLQSRQDYPIEGPSVLRGHRHDQLGVEEHRKPRRRQPCDDGHDLDLREASVMAASPSIIPARGS
jgi:hypothetical protein